MRLLMRTAGSSWRNLMCAVLFVAMSNVGFVFLTFIIRLWCRT